MRQSFYRLCLVSRAFCHAGRRFLYRQPLLGGKLDSHALVRLVETLRANQRYLGKLVIDLSEADSAYEVLLEEESTLDSTSFQFRGLSKAFSWQLAMFSSCPNCRAVSAGYATEAELKKLVRIGLSSLPDLRHIKLVSLDGGVAIPALGHLDSLHVLSQLSSVEIDGIEPQGPSAKQVPQSSLSLQKLTVNDFDTPLCSLLLFVPTASSSSLTELCLPFFVALEDDLIRLVTFTPQLVKLTLKTAALDPVNYLIWDYAADVEGVRVPTQFFALLPNIVRLELVSLAALSVQRLQILAKHSPKLKRLSAQGSVWLDDEAAFPTVNDLASLFPNFKRLKFAHLGTIPLPENETLVKPLRTTFKTMRAKLEFDVADDTCPNCGQRH